MLSYFKVKNFKSIIEDKFSFDFREGKLPNNYKMSEIIYGFVNVYKKQKEIFVPVSAFFGENASGKSTIIESFFIFQNIIKNNKLEYLPNILNTKNKNIRFELEMIINKISYVYILEYNLNSILEESLYKNKNIVYSIQNKKTNFDNIIIKNNKLFNKETINNIFETACIDKINGNIQTKLFLSCIKEQFQSLNDDISIFYKNIIENLEIYLSNSFPTGYSIDKLSPNNSDEELQNSFNEIISILQKLDLGIKSAVFKRENKEQLNESINLTKYSSIKLNNNIISLDSITTQHKNVQGQLVNFNFKQQESLGTQKLFGIIGIFLDVLKNGKVLIIDELEQSLHPILLKSLIMMFKDKRYNKNNAQLIFTTHNTDILDNNILRISEVNIVSKTLKNGTKTNNLSEFKNEDSKTIRNVTNFRKGYLNGLYGGIPFITL